MYRPRIIPVLLLKNEGLTKTVRFGKGRYIGDPINAVKIFNDLEADELIFLDINATKEKRSISLDLVKKIGDEAFMPFAVGGGIKTMDNVSDVLTAGAEKVILNSVLGSGLELIKEASLKFGNQSVVASIDVKKGIFKKYNVYLESGSKKMKTDLVEFAQSIEKAGAGEIMINSIDRDGLMEGYDIELISLVSNCVTIPVIACGGAGSNADLLAAHIDGDASASAAGSMFVYHGPRKGVLINYPTRVELNKIFTDARI